MSADIRACWSNLTLGKFRCDALQLGHYHVLRHCPQHLKVDTEMLRRGMKMAAPEQNRQVEIV